MILLHVYIAIIPGINDENALLTAGGTDSGNDIVILFSLI